MVKPRNGLIAICDVGTTKIVCLIVRVEGEQLHVIGVGHHLSQGFRAGMITDVHLAEQSVVAAVDAAERMAEETVDKIVVNISGSKAASHHITAHMSIPGAVTDKEVNKIITLAVEQHKNHHPNREIIHSTPLEYAMDGVGGIKDPRSMVGKQLTAQLHVISASETAVMNLANCLARCQLDVRGLVISAYASGLSCLTRDEMELGVTLLEMGGGNTSFAVFKGGNVLYTDTLPLGGQHVTSDIARGLSTHLAAAERLKTLYGNCFTTQADEKELIEVPFIGEDEVEMEAHYIPRSHLIGIIRARVEEILELTRERMEAAGLVGAVGKTIVLTGGASQLLGMKELAGQIFQKHIRLGTPRFIPGLSEDISGPAFATSIGMIQFALSRSLQTKREIGEEKPERKTVTNKVIKWLQENF